MLPLQTATTLAVTHPMSPTVVLIAGAGRTVRQELLVAGTCAAAPAIIVQLTDALQMGPSSAAGPIVIQASNVLARADASQRARLIAGIITANPVRDVPADIAHVLRRGILIVAAIIAGPERNVRGAVAAFLSVALIAGLTTVSLGSAVRVVTARVWQPMISIVEATIAALGTNAPVVDASRRWQPIAAIKPLAVLD